jgi:hypothetical protein
MSFDIMYRDGVIGDAKQINDIYLQADMINFDEGITEEMWVQKWEWRIKQKSQIFIVAVDNTKDLVVGVIRGGINYHPTTNENLSLLNLRENEITCKYSTKDDEIVSYTGTDDEEEKLGKIITTFGKNINKYQTILRNF